ncbi:hypothetical protein F2Q70_00029872 [Brassica cretica]|uniref:Uncharacterized protein n=1 Tax=Brassica cretica TaxID=69181 RepID=A0A8S9FS62_BRACR|nr:hypothetical protein F2Q70_00029872 [Brassica cretica]
MDWPCSKSNSGTLIRQATGSRRRSLFVFFFFPKLLHPRRIGSFAFLRRSSAPSHFPSLASSSYSLRFISFSCTDLPCSRSAVFDLVAANLRRWLFIPRRTRVKTTSSRLFSLGIVQSGHQTCLQDLQGMRCWLCIVGSASCWRLGSGNVNFCIDLSSYLVWFLCVQDCDKAVGIKLR